MLSFEKRPQPSKFWIIFTPILAVILTLIAGAILFSTLGKPPLESLKIIFWDPLFHPNYAAYSRPQLLIKAGPLILIAIGLSFGFKAGVWNIGAEGQYIIGAVIGGGVALAFYPYESIIVFPLAVLFGAIGGFLWAMIPVVLTWVTEKFKIPEYPVPNCCKEKKSRKNNVRCRNSFVTPNSCIASAFTINCPSTP